MKNFYSHLCKFCVLMFIYFSANNQILACGGGYNGWNDINLSVEQGTDFYDRVFKANNGPDDGNYAFTIRGGHFIDDQGRNIGTYIAAGDEVSPRFIVDNANGVLGGCVYVRADISVFDEKNNGTIRAYEQAFYGNSQFQSGNLGFVKQNAPGFNNTNDQITATSTTLQCDQGVTLSVPYYANTTYTWNVPDAIIGSNWGQGIYISRFRTQGSITASVTMTPTIGYCYPDAESLNYPYGSLTRTIQLAVSNIIPPEFVVTGPTNLLASGEWIRRVRANSPIPVTCGTNLTLNAPFVNNCNYSWSFPGAVISGSKTGTTLVVSGFTTTGATRATCTITPKAGYCGIAGTGYTDYNVTGPTKADVSQINNLTSTITPACKSTYPVAAPYFDGKSSYTFTIPSTQFNLGWYFENYKSSSSVTVSENTSLKLISPVILNTSAFKISGTINQPCWGSQSLPDITVNAYNPIPSNLSVSGPTSLCLSNYGSINFQAQNNSSLNGARYNWKINSTYIPGTQGINNANTNIYAGLAGVLPNATNSVTVVVDQIPCVDPGTVAFASTSFNSSYSGDVSPNPATVDPATGLTTLCVQNANTSNTYDWSSLKPYGFKINNTSANCVTLQRDYTVDPKGSNSLSYGQVYTNNTICPNVLLSYTINPTLFSYSITPAFTTVCPNSSVTLKVNVSGGTTPYLNGQWKTYDSNLQQYLVPQDDGSCKVNAPGVATNISIYYSVVDSKGNVAVGSPAQINVSNAAGGISNGGWASGQLVNTACATNDILKSSNFVAQYLGTNVIYYIKSDNTFHYYFFDLYSSLCSGSNSWVQDRGIDYYFSASPPFSLANSVPIQGTPLIGGKGVGVVNGVFSDVFQLFYLGNNSRIFRINGDGTVSNFPNTIIINTPGNFIFDGSNLYTADGTLLKKTTGDVSSTPINTNVQFTPIAYNVGGRYIGYSGTNIYYAGTDGKLCYVNSNGTSSSVSTGNQILSTSDIKEVDGNLVYLIDNSHLAYYSNGQVTSIQLPLGVTGSGRLAPVAGAAGKSIFITGTDGNLYQAINKSGTWSVIKATSSNVQDNANGSIGSGHSTYNGSNILYTNSTGNIWNLYGSCGNTLRKEDSSENSIAESTSSPIIFDCYPNPFSSSLKFDLSTVELTTAKIQVIDVLGNVVETLNETTPKSGNRSFQYSSEGLPKGVYIAKLFLNGNFVKNQKLICE